MQMRLVLQVDNELPQLGVKVFVELIDHHHVRALPQSPIDVAAFYLQTYASPLLQRQGSALAAPPALVSLPLPLLRVQGRGRRMAHSIRLSAVGGLVLVVIHLKGGGEALDVVGEQQTGGHDLGENLQELLVGEQTLL